MMQAWRLYKRGCLLDMIDSTLAETLRQEQDLRCIQAGLLCTQSDASLRPFMSNVILMISSASVTLENPIKPAFVKSSDSSRGGSTTTSSSSGIQQSRSSASTQNPLVPSTNDVTISELEARQAQNLWFLPQMMSLVVNQRLGSTKFSQFIVKKTGFRG